MRPVRGSALGLWLAVCSLCDKFIKHIRHGSQPGELTHFLFYLEAIIGAVSNPKSWWECGVGRSVEEHMEALEYKGKKGNLRK